MGVLVGLLPLLGALTENCLRRGAGPRSLGPLKLLSSCGGAEADIYFFCSNPTEASQIELNFSAV